MSLLRASAEHLPFGVAVFDTIVMTWTLCSIASPLAALFEMRRVLKPGGQLLFVEHGLSPETGIARWQHWLTPCWRWIGGGCHLDRKMDDLIRAAGFQIDAIETSYMQGPKPWTFMYRGSAKNDRAELSGQQAAQSGIAISRMLRVSAWVGPDGNWIAVGQPV
jgi:SAM-dependent methyltransferase